MAPNWSKLLSGGALYYLFQISENLLLLFFLPHDIHGVGLDNADGQRKQLRVIHRKYYKLVIFAQRVLFLATLDDELGNSDIFTCCCAYIHL